MALVIYNGVSDLSLLMVAIRIRIRICYKSVEKNIIVQNVEA